MFSQSKIQSNVFKMFSQDPKTSKKPLILAVLSTLGTIRTRSKPTYFVLYMLYIKPFLSLIYTQYTIIHNKIKNLRTFFVPLSH